MNTSTNTLSFNVKEAIEEEKYNDVINYSNQSRIKLFAVWNDGDKALIRKTISYIETATRRIANLLKTSDVKNRMMYELGCLQGAIAAISHVLYCEKKQEESAASYRNKLQYIVHLSDIVKTIDKKGPLSHSDLSAELQMKPSTLSEAMKKVLLENVVSVTISGKYKVYSLTDQGRHYVKYLRTLNDTDDTTGNESEGWRSKRAEEDIINSKIASLVSIEKNALFPGDKISFNLLYGEEKYLGYGNISSVIDQGKNKSVGIEAKFLTYDQFADSQVV